MPVGRSNAGVNRAIAGGRSNRLKKLKNAEKVIVAKA